MNFNIQITSLYLIVITEYKKIYKVLRTKLRNYYYIHWNNSGG
jgi:hypothetical protein